MRTALLLAACALGLGACTTSRPAADVPVTALSTVVVLDSAHIDLPPYLVPAPAGSSPRQRRQWQAAQAANLARAGVGPEKVKIRNSTVAAGTGTVATTITKPDGPVATGPGSATDNTKAGQKGGSAATAPDAVATTTTTTEKGLSYWWLLVPVAGLLYWQRKRLALLVGLAVLPVSFSAHAQQVDSVAMLRRDYADQKRSTRFFHAQADSFQLALSEEKNRSQQYRFGMLQEMDLNHKLNRDVKRLEAQLERRYPAPPLYQAPPKIGGR